MKPSIISLCDFAQEFGGKINIIGAFNEVTSKKFPTEPISFFLACQFTFRADELGDHYVNIDITDTKDGSKLAHEQLRLNIAQQPQKSEDIGFGAANLLLEFKQVSFQKPTIFAIRVEVDDESYHREFQVRAI